MTKTTMSQLELSSFTKLWEDLQRQCWEGYFNEDTMCDLFSDYLYERGYDYDTYCETYDLSC